MANEKTVITVNLDMFDKDADAKTAEANKVAKNLGISEGREFQAGAHRS